MVPKPLWEVEPGVSRLEKGDREDDAVHYVFRSIVALHSFRLKLCSVKYIVKCAAGR